MKDLKFLKYLFLVLVLAGFASCSSDDDDEKKSDETSDTTSDATSLQGTWTRDFSSGTSFYIFKKNGHGYEFEIDEDDMDRDREVDMEVIRYSYDDDERILTIKEVYEDDVDVFTKVSIKEDRITWLDPDGDRETYYRYDGDIEDIEEEWDVFLYEED